MYFCVVYPCTFSGDRFSPTERGQCRHWTDFLGCSFLFNIPQSIACYLSLMISFSTLKFSFFTSCRENRHLCDLRRERCLYRFHISLLPSSICSCGYTESIHLFIPATFYFRTTFWVQFSPYMLDHIGAQQICLGLVWP